MKPKFRSCGSRDAGLLLPLIRAYYRYDGIPFSAPKIARSLSKLLQRRSLGRIWIIELGTRTAGYIMLSYNFDLEFGGIQGIITDLYIRPAYRGLGLGSTALTLVEDFCLRKGIRAVELQVTTRNRSARKFYRKAGFSEKARTVMGKELRVAAI